MEHLKYLGVTVIFCLFFLPAYNQSQNDYHVRPLFELDQLSTGEAYAWISDDGLRIYYTAFDRENNVYALWHSRRQNPEDDFSFHNKLPINTDTQDNFSCWLSQDENTMAFVRRTTEGDTDTNIYLAERNNASGTFDDARKLTLHGGVKGTIISPSFTQDMEELIFFNEYRGHSYILVYRKEGADTYGFSYQMSFPARYRAKTGKLSTDGLEYYISIQDRHKKPSMFTFSRETTNEKFSQIGKIDHTHINDPDYRNHQVYFSSNKNFVVFTRSEENRWHSNSIYIGQRKGYIPVPDMHQVLNADYLDKIVVFPNPSIDNIYFKNTEGHNVKILMFDASGILVRELDSLADDSAISISKMMPGAYYFKLIDLDTRNYRIIKHIKL